MPTATDVCCCGHMRTYHLAGSGPCAMCGARSCAQFHAVGEGHNAVLKIIALVVVAALVWVAVH